MKCAVSFVFLVAVVLSSAGCGSSETASLQKGSGPEIITWDALRTLQSPDIIMGVGRNSELGNFGGLKTHVQDSKFIEAVNAFEAESMPAKYVTPEREAARTELINDLKSLIDAAKANATNDQLKVKANAVQASLKKLTSG